MGLISVDERFSDVCAVIWRKAEASLGPPPTSNAPAATTSGIWSTGSCTGLSTATFSAVFESTERFCSVKDRGAGDTTRSGSGLNRADDIFESRGVADENSDGSDSASSTDLQSLARVGEKASLWVGSAARTLLEWLRKFIIVSETDAATKLLACNADTEFGEMLVFAADGAASDALNDER